VAAVIAAVLLVAGTVAVTGTGDGHVRSGGQVGQIPSQPGPPPSDPALDAAMPPEGATPSTPETGEVVAAISFVRGAGSAPNVLGDTWFNLYADGRLLREQAPEAHGGIGEQRLTPEGVELVRSEFLSTGLFDAGHTTSDVVLWCGCFARVRDDSGRLVAPALSEPPVDPQAARANSDPRVRGEVDRLVEFMTHLESSLPETAWADREITVYVPSRYQLDVYIPTPDFNGSVRNLSKVLARVLPRPLVRHLDEQGWHRTVEGDSVELTTADARVLHQALTNARVGLHNEGARLVYTPFPYRWHSRDRDTDAARQQRATRRAAIQIGLRQLLPDGKPYWAPG
jgi:hypothetical protein